MCVAIAQLKGSKALTRTEWENGWSNNDDGAGYAFIDEDNNIVIKKSMDGEAFYKEYKEDHDAYGEHSPFIVHMRIATHGDVKIDTCHPFIARPGVAFAHNGIIRHVAKHTDNDTSDTMAFGARLLANMPAGFADDDVMTEVMEGYLTGNKVVMLVTEEGWEEQLYILNEDLGYWDNDTLTWFSNASCEYFYGYNANPATNNYSSWLKKSSGVVKALPKPSPSHGSFSDWLEWEDELDGGNHGAAFLAGSPPNSEDLYWTADDWMLADPDDIPAMLAVLGYDVVHCLECTGLTKCYCNFLCMECNMTVTECDCEEGFFSMANAPDSRAYRK